MLITVHLHLYVLHILGLTYLSTRVSGKIRRDVLEAWGWQLLVITILLSNFPVDTYVGLPTVEINRLARVAGRSSLVLVDLDWDTGLGARERQRKAEKCRERWNGGVGRQEVPENSC